MDSVDRDIILVLLGHEQTVHQLSKALKKRDSFLRYRLGRLAEEGLVRRKSNGEKGVYLVPLDSITYGKARVTITTKHDVITLDLGSVLVTERDGLKQMVTLG